MDRILRHIELMLDTVPQEDVYPFNIPAIRSLTRLEFHPQVTLLVGENGSGKSTLIEAIAIRAGFNPEGGSKNFTFRHRPSESALHAHLRLARGARRERSGFFLRAETMFNAFTAAEEYSRYGWERCHEMSHGEAFLWVVQHRFRQNGLYILDEPEAALSPRRQLDFLARVRQLALAGAQFIISTHSPLLMTYPDATLFLLGDGAIEKVQFKDTDHYLITKKAMDDPTIWLETSTRH